MVDDDNGTATTVWIQVCVLALLAAALVTGTAVGIGAASPAILQYGFLAFVILPVIQGFVAGKLLRDRHKLSRTLSAGALTILFSLAVLLAIGREGFICLIMAAPLAIPLGILGAWFAFRPVQRPKQKPGKGFPFTAIALLPIGFLADAHYARIPVHRFCSTKILIHAESSKVWPLLSNLNRISSTSFWMFQRGVAFPVAIKSEGAGTGAKRVCQLSTGGMPETVTVWQPNRVLRFHVLDTPPSMKEMSPYGYIHTEHLKGYFECEDGQFELIPQPNGDTLLVETSWYHFRFYPAQYWALWSDKIVSEIQLMVMQEVKNRAEQSR